MFIIAGLGNPEKDYKNTRHNLGFETINKLAYDHDIAINRAKFHSHCGDGTISSQKVTLLKPQTFMNLSGRAVRDALAFYKLTPRELVVIYDDTALSVGHVRVRERGSAGGHNGIKDIIYQLGTDEFLRVRIGIGQKPHGWELSDYVLSRFKPNEMEAVINGVTDAASAVEEILRSGAQSAMNRFNKREEAPSE